MHFMVKVILIDFQLEKYMKCKEKCLHFSCSIDVTVTSQNGVTSFYMSQRAYRFFVACCVEMVRKCLWKHKNENFI